MKLTRFFQDAVCTLGHLVANDNGFECYVLERPATGDHPCIPAGTYTVGFETHHPGTPTAYECPVLDTSALGRTHVQIHVANYPNQLLGCLAVGESYSEAEHSVSQSQSAFDRLMAYLSDAGVKTWTLTITDPS